MTFVSLKAVFRLNKYLFLAVVSIVIAVGCAGESSSGDASEEDTRSTLDISENTQDDREITVIEPPSSEPVVYTREQDYPNMAKLPLAFFVSSTGKKIGVNVTLPADESGKPAEGVFPALLVQTAYNMSMLSFVTPIGALLGGPDPYFVKRGYALVAVDVYGTGVSEGAWELIGEEEQLAYGEAVDWILQQSWSDSQVGTSGTSYMGISALVAAQLRPDAVKAVFAVNPLGDAQRGTAGTGGMLNGLFMSAWMTLTQKLGTQNVIATVLNPEHTSQIRLSTQEHIDHIDDYYLPLINDALEGKEYIKYDGEFWRTRSPLENMDKIKAPSFITGALHDIFQRDEPLIYEALKNNNIDTRLAVFEGDHLSSLGESSPGNDAIGPLKSLMLQWFDKHIKGIDSGTEKIPAVTQYIKNYKSDTSDGFSTTTDWPHPLARPERWYLNGDMSLSKELPLNSEPNRTMNAMDDFAEVNPGKSAGGEFFRLDITIKDGTECSTSYRQWTLGTLFSFTAPPCFFDSKELEENALNYESAPMAEDYYINGPIQADVWIATTAEEAAVSIRVDEVSPDGSVVAPFSNGLLAASARAVNTERSRYLNGEMIQPYHYLTEEKVSEVIPGEVMKMQIEIFPTSAIIRKDHRLRISISASNQAQGIMDYNQREKSFGGVTTIYNSPEYPSSVVMPIVPISSLN